MMDYSIKTIGLDGLYESFSGLAKNNSKAASNAVNDTARKTLTLGRKHMPSIVNINAAYFNKDRFFVSKFANPTTMQAIVAGRDKPTSLYAFSPKQAALKPGFIAYKGKVSASVKPGRQSSFDAYILRMKSGNLGLAVRSQGHPRGSSGAKQIGNTGLWLLYGPSVNQVFANARTDMAPELGNYLSGEYIRQVKRMLHG